MPSYYSLKIKPKRPRAPRIVSSQLAADCHEQAARLASLLDSYPASGPPIDACKLRTAISALRSVLPGMHLPLATAVRDDARKLVLEAFKLK